MKTKHVALLTIIVLVVLIIYQLSSNKKKLNEKIQPIKASVIKIPVKVTEVISQVQEINILKTGSLIPFKEAKALAVTSGTLQRVNFNLGDQVNQGQLLAITDNHSAKLELQKAENNLAKLKDDLNTYNELLAGKATTLEKVNQIHQNYLEALNQVSQVKKSLADANITAPTSGIISVKSIEQGVFANAGTEIATIINLSRAKVQVNLTEAEVYQIENKQKVKIRTDVYPGKTFTGIVSFISPQADQTHNYMVEILVDNTEKSLLRSGTFIYADFTKKTTQKILFIPREALIESIKNASVFVIKGGIAQQRPIQTGTEMGDLIQVIDGLSEGEQVVTSGQINLKSGSQVNISQ